MAARMISLALIAAIVACPLLCRNGYCEGCCAVEKTAPSICPAGGTGDCCYPTASEKDTSRDGESRRPCDDDSGESGCQGVCGGAVLDKPSSLPAPAELAFLEEFTANSTPSLPGLADRQTPAVESRCDCSMNPGRYIRTLHSSRLL